MSPERTFTMIEGDLDPEEALDGGIVCCPANIAHAADQIVNFGTGDELKQQCYTTLSQGFAIFGSRWL